MDIHIWISIYRYPYMDIHIRISIYGYPYMGSQGSLGGSMDPLGDRWDLGTDGTWASRTPNTSSELFYRYPAGVREKTHRNHFRLFFPARAGRASPGQPGRKNNYLEKNRKKCPEHLRNTLKTSRNHLKTIPKPSQNHPKTIPKPPSNLPLTSF